MASEHPAAPAPPPPPVPPSQPARPAPLGTPTLDGDAYFSTRTWLRSGTFFSARFILERMLRNAFGSHTAFMTSNPDIDNETWRPVRILGQGGFGHVGLWNKVDELEQVMDEMVIKEMQYDQQRYIQGMIAVPNVPGLLNEAVINRDLNAHMYGGSINHLLQYKYNPDSQLCRFYMIFCPHGDLDRVQLIYHIWDRFLPELFIWHIFVALAQAYVALSAPPPPDTRFNQTDLSTHFTLHFDLKPGNVLLDRTQSTPSLDDTTPIDDLLNSYPAVRMSDLGLALYTDDTTDTANPVDFHNRGTRFYIPPEQTNWGSSFRVRPYAIQRSYQKQFNAWGIGKAVFDTMASQGYSHLKQLMENRNVEHCWDEHKHFLAGADDLMKDEHANVYSQELRQLVYDCLSPVPESRPSAPVLLKRAQDGFQNYRQALSDQPDNVAAEKLYCEQNDINSLGQGTAKFSPHRDDILLLRNYADPDLPRWRFPPGKYRQFLNDCREPPIFQHNFEGENIWFRRARQPGSVASTAPAPNPNAQAAAAAQPQPQPQPQAGGPPLPTRQAYEALTKEQLTRELIHRDNNLAENDLMRRRKNSLVSRILAMDQNGILGRGANRAPRPNKRKRKG